VVGGGTVATRKVEGLLEAGAQIKIISPLLSPELQQMVNLEQVDYIPRQFQDGDLEGAYLTIAATDDPGINQSVWLEAERCGCLINVVDDPSHSNFILPAVVKRGEMSVAISTGGNSPALAHRLRQRFEKMIGPDYGVLTEILGELRPELIANFQKGEERLQAALRVVDSDILAIINTHGKESALTYGRELLQQQQ
jgi:precorrin-2 dehydrogenase/sirohydrochlorin ferrochelatase